MNINFYTLMAIMSCMQLQAAEMGQSPAIKLQADLDKQLAITLYAIDYAPEHRRQDINFANAVELMDKEADVQVKSGYGTGDTFLILAARYNRNDLIPRILTHGAEINTQNKRGVTALMAAARAGNADTIKTLLETGANPLLEDATGKTARDHFIAIIAENKLSESTSSKILKMLQDAENAYLAKRKRLLPQNILQQHMEKTGQRQFTNVSQELGPEISKYL